MRNNILGKKGGGGGGSQTQTPDNLRSEDTVEVILGLSEGPIFGLERGAKSFFVGETQLQNEDNTYNFTAFTLNLFPGTEAADPVVPVLGGLTINNAVNLTLASNISVTRQTNSGQIDYFDIRLAVNQLVKSNAKGTFSTSVTFRIEFKPLSSSTWEKAFGKDIEITGKTSSTYVKELRIAVARINEPYQIRLTKISGENTTEYFANIAWESFQETIAETKAYNNTAVLQLVAKASDQFSSIPTWSGVYKGLLVKVPDNYNPITRTYTGVWTGNFNLAWTDNPAWCTYDFVMNDRYGIRAYYPDMSLDKYDTYEAGQWCDELVPNGQGGTQPRYTFNAYLSEARSGRELAKYMAGSFNATFFDDLNGTSYLRVDKDDPALHVFTKENIIGGEFEYTYTDITSRYNDITVTFRNPDLNWSEDRRRVYSDSYISKNGRIPLDFIAVGCIDAHEAIRRAQYKLITANTETCMIRFTTNRLGQFVNPFDVMLICDPDMGYGLSGRIKSIAPDGKSVTLRDPVYLEAGVAYGVEFQLSNSQRYSAPTIDTTTGYNYTLKFATPLPVNQVPIKAVFTITQSDYVGTPRPFRVMKVEEVDGNSDQYVIEGIVINRNKWYDADNITDTGVIDYSTLPNPFDPPGPTACTFTEQYKKDLKQFFLTVTPTFNRGAYKYYMNDHSFEVWSRLKNSGEGFTKQTLYYGDTLIDHPPGLHEFKVLGKSVLGKTTSLNNAPIYEFNVTNPKDPPIKPDWVKINSREVYWGYATPPDDFAGFRVRYQNVAGRTLWEDAIQPHSGLITSTSFYTNLIPASARVIMVKAVDDFGVESDEAAIIYRAIADVSTTNVVETFDFHPTWSGTKTNCSILSGTLIADDTGGLVYSGTPTAYMYPGLPAFYVASYNDMIYVDSFTISKAGSLVPSVSFEGDGYELYIKPSTETVWQIVPAELAISAGTYDIKIRIPGGSIRGRLNSLSLLIDVPDISEEVTDIVVNPTGLVRIPLTKSYSVIKIIRVTIQDDGVNEPVSYRIMDKNVVLGPEIKLLDPTGAVSAGLIDVEIKGY